MNTLQHAKKLVSLGFSVFPLVKDSKLPAVKWKEFQNRKPTDIELERWFSSDTHDIAIVTGKVSGISVIDCDNDEAQRKAADLKLCSPIAQMTKRGCHYLHRFSDQRNTTRLHGVDGIDQRGEGGYIKAYEGSKYWSNELLSSLPMNRACDDMVQKSQHPKTTTIRKKRATIQSDTFFVAKIVNGCPEEPQLYSLETLPQRLVLAIRKEIDHAFSVVVNSDTFAIIRCY